MRSSVNSLPVASERASSSQVCSDRGLVSMLTASASVSQCGMRLPVWLNVTVCVYSWRSTSSQSKVPRCLRGLPVRGTSMAITGPVDAAMVWMPGMPVIRTPKNS